MRTPEVIVVGLGAAGAATLYQLARLGVPAIGIDSHSPPHDLGSTHGDTRVTREAIGEGMQYTPLVQRSHAIWRELEAETGQDLLTQCGGLIIEKPGSGPAGHHHGDFFAATVASANRYGIPHELLDPDEVTARFPQFKLDGDESAYYEPSAGFVRPERCVDAQLAVAERLGAQVQRNERVLAIESNAGIVRVRTDRDVYEAPRAVLAVGPWIEDFVDQRELVIFRVYRQILIWYALRPGSGDHSPGVMPIYIWRLGDGNAFYGFPEVDGDHSIKVATEQLDVTTTADSASKDVEASETQTTYDKLIGPRLPQVSPHCDRAVRCLYTVTPDSDFVVDEHPDLPGVLLVSPCSGHGFKHSAGLGEAIAQFVTTGTSAVDLSPFRIGRFSEFRAAG